MPIRDLINRVSFGYSIGDELHPKTGKPLDWPSWVDIQLQPKKDPALQKRLQDATLEIRFRALRSTGGVTTEDMREQQYERPLAYLDAGPAELMPLVSREAEDKKPFAERKRPLDEIRAAAWLRQLYSPFQVEELMVDFWHNHFNVYGEGGPRIAAFFPLHDQAIRKQAFGNFRQLLESIAQSPAMLYYLNNNESKASPANENYARELFELHTLGSAHYLNNLYAKWKEVPGAFEEKPIGYIDQDVYEAARAFTGWTVGDGSRIGGGESLPETGAFFYYDSWHDPYQKRVLGVEIEANQPALADGRKVLDLVAFHPGTAKHICQKIAQRIIGETLPEGLLTAMLDTWQKNQKAPDQIAQVLKTLLLSTAFTQNATPSKKLKRPDELYLSYLRAVKAQWKPHPSQVWFFKQAGYLPFGWPAPTGYPDKESYWLSSQMMLMRWNGLIGLRQQQQWLTIDWLSVLPFPKDATPTTIAQSWHQHLTGKAEGPALAPAAQIITKSTDLAEGIAKAATLIALGPDFQYK